MFAKSPNKNCLPRAAGKMPTVGVLSFQGDVSEHLEMIKRAGGNPMPVKRPHELQLVDALIIPGGESTTVGRLLKETGLDAAIEKRVNKGMPVWGTCMGAILLAKNLQDNLIDQPTLKLMNISVRRNAYGRQRESFEEEIPIPVLDEKAFPCVFIRAPEIEKTGPGVEILASFQGKPVLVEEGNLMASSFHSEIAGDARIHRYFMKKIGRERGSLN